MLFERIFSITSKLSDLLQAEKLNYAAAATCISATKRAITSLREEDEWFRIWEEAKSMGDEHGVPVRVARSRSRRSQSMTSRYNDSVVEETTGHGSIAVNDYRTHLYYRIIDIISEEMDNRFSDFNLTLLSAMQALLPGSQNFLDIHSLGPFLQHYCIDIDEARAEVATAKSFLADTDTLDDALQTVRESFPALLKCFQVAMTMGVSTASAERSFSSLRCLKTYLRSTMTQDRLTDLALLYVERGLSSQLWDSNVLDEIAVKFSEQHKNSRVLFFNLKTTPTNVWSHPI